jgi:hypothetical protein
LLIAFCLLAKDGVSDHDSQQKKETAEFDQRGISRTSHLNKGLDLLILRRSASGLIKNSSLYLAWQLHSRNA